MSPLSQIRRIRVCWTTTSCSRQRRVKASTANQRVCFWCRLSWRSSSSLCRCRRSLWQMDNLEKVSDECRLLDPDLDALKLWLCVTAAEAPTSWVQFCLGPKGPTYHFLHWTDSSLCASFLTVCSAPRWMMGNNILIRLMMKICTVQLFFEDNILSFNAFAPYLWVCLMTSTVLRSFSTHQFLHQLHIFLMKPLILICLSSSSLSFFRGGVLGWL